MAHQHPRFVTLHVPYSPTALPSAASAPDRVDAEKDEAKYISRSLSPPLPTIPDLNSRAYLLVNLLGHYLPAAQVFAAVSDVHPPRLTVRVADAAEKCIALRLAAELCVSGDAIDLCVDLSVHPSTSFFLTTSVIAAARADASFSLAVQYAIMVLLRTVLDASIELWDKDALAAATVVAAAAVAVAAGAPTGGAVVRGACTGSPVSAACGPPVEIRVAVCAEQLALADAVCTVIRDAFSPECVCISAVVRTVHNLTGSFPPLMEAASIRVRDMTQPATHPGFSSSFTAIVPAVDAGLPASAGAAGTAAPASTGGAAAAARSAGGVVGAPLQLPPGAVEIPTLYKPGHAAASGIKGRMTVSAYAVVDGTVAVVSTGHELGDSPAPVMCLQTRDTPLDLLVYSNPPGGSGTCRPFMLANSSDAIPHAPRIPVDARPARATTVMIKVTADVSLSLLQRQATAAEADLVPVDVLSRQQVVELSGPHSALGLVAYDDVRGPILFAGCTVPGALRALSIVGLVIKRVPHALPAVGSPGDASVTAIAPIIMMVTYISTHDSSAVGAGAAPAAGDSGGPCIRPGGGGVVASRLHTRPAGLYLQRVHLWWQKRRRGGWPSAQVLRAHPCGTCSCAAALCTGRPRRNWRCVADVHATQRGTARAAGGAEGAAGGGSCSRYRDNSRSSASRSSSRSGDSSRPVTSHALLPLCCSVWSVSASGPYLGPSSLALPVRSLFMACHG